MPATTASLRVHEGTHPASSDSTPSSTAFTKLSALIPHENELRFCTAVGLADYIEAKIEECLESETGCYMLVTGVAENMIEPIEEAMEELGIRNTARFTYEHTIESLIVRLMPGASHELVSWSLWYKIQDKFSDISSHLDESLLPVGSTTVHAAGRRSKQCDAGFRPRDSRALGDQWPSVVIEVGCSGSLPALRCDAEWWLVYSRGQTRMAIIVQITRNPNSLRLECWEMVADPNRRATRNITRWRPGYNQHFEIDDSGAVTPAGSDLVIPRHTLFDTSQPGDLDIILSAEELSRWALGIYAWF